MIQLEWLYVNECGWEKFFHDCIWFPTMPEVGISEWESLEQRRSTLFFVAGGLLAIVAGLWAVEVFMNTDMKLARIVAPAGMAVAFVGLLGLYPGLVDRTPWLARAGAFFAAVGVVGTGVIAVIAGSQLLGIILARPTWANLFELPLLIGIVLGFITFGVASLRTDAYSRAVGLLLLVPGILFPAVLVTVSVMGGDFPYVVHVIHNGADALVLLVVGYLLRPKDMPTDRAEPTPDTTRG